VISGKSVFALANIGCQLAPFSSLSPKALKAKGSKFAFAAPLQKWTNSP